MTVNAVRITTAANFDEIIERAYKMRNDWFEKFGDFADTKPVGWLLGPPEYLGLMTHDALSRKYYHMVCTLASGKPAMLLGLPIKLKSGAGMEFEVDDRMIWHLARRETI